MAENKEFGGGEGLRSATRAGDRRVSAFTREETGAHGGFHGGSYSTDPGRNLPKRPENQGFPVIQGDRQRGFASPVDLPSINACYRWLDAQPTNVLCEEL